jgi:GNAT superfamily N-acetyltransferase
MKVRTRSDHPPQATDVARQLEGLALAAHRPGSSLVDEIRRFRGEMIWDGGARPAFRALDGRFIDQHPADPEAYHLVLRKAAGQPIIACIACAPLETLPESVVRNWNPILSDRLLDEHGVDESSVLEGARLVVAPEWRGRGVGQLMVLGLVAVGQAIGRRLLWGTPGTRQHQHRLLLAAGLQVREEYGRRYVPELADTLCVVAGDPNQVSPQARDAVAQVRSVVEQSLEAA